MKPKAVPVSFPSRGRPPHNWCSEVHFLISPPKIRNRVKELALAISWDFRGKELVLVGVLNGSVMFLSDLCRDLWQPLCVDFVGVSSYRSGTTRESLIWTKRLQVSVRDKYVLVVDDILDTGRTLKWVTAEIRKQRPRELRTCVLLDKPSRREVPFEADYAGFSVPDVFVVGYGLDYRGLYRNLPFLGMLRPFIPAVKYAIPLPDKADDGAR